MQHIDWAAAAQYYDGLVEAKKRGITGWHPGTGGWVPAGHWAFPYCTDYRASAIGAPKETIRIEPVETPIPRETPQVAPEPAETPTPVKEPVGA